MKDRKQLVSVVMPCYNDGETICESVASLSGQEWPEIELIIVNDGSDDPKTREIIESITFPRLQVLHTERRGPAAARNAGIAAASGEYILPLDADDTIEPAYIARALEVLEKDESIGAVYCHADMFGEEQGPWALADYSLENELLDNCVFVTALFRKADWKSIGGFCEEFRAGMEDYDFWLSMLEMGKKIIQLPEVYFHYRVKKTSRSTKFQKNYADVQDTYVRLYDRHKELYRQHMDTYCKALRWHLIDQMLINKKLIGDPLVEYIAAVRDRKPRLGKSFEKILQCKDRVCRLLGRR